MPSSDPPFCITPACRLRAMSRLNVVVVVSRLDCQNSLPPEAGLMPPNVPVPTICRSPLSSGFDAVVEFGLRMYTKCVPEFHAPVVVADCVIVGAVGDGFTPVT